MAKGKIDYEHFFKQAQPVKASVRISPNLAREANGEISAISGNRVRMEILGGDAPKALATQKPGSRLTLSGWSGWGFYCCEAVLVEVVSPKEFDLRLEGAVEEIQRREYFRLDVSVPVVVTIPPQQTIASLSEQWETKKSKTQEQQPPRLYATPRGYRAVTATKEEIPPQDINLSGGGLRLRMPTAVTAGSRVHVDIFLPLAPAKTISAVAEVLRCNEVTLRIEKAPVFISAMKFILIEEQDREAIIAFLFAEQRIQLQSESNRELPTPSIR